MNPPWWAAFGPAEAQLGCGDAEHRLRWADGKLQPVDHPDADGELVLAALGGDSSPCLDLVRAWGRHSDDLTVLAVGPRSARDPVTIPAAVLAELDALHDAASQQYGSGGTPVPQAARSGHASVSIGGTVTNFSAYRPGRSRRIASYGGFRGSRGGARLLGRRPLARPFRHGFAGRTLGWSGPLPQGMSSTDVDKARIGLIRLLALGPPFQFRLSAAVAHAWSADGEHASRAQRARPALTAALAGRLAPAVAQWLDIDPGEVDAAIHDGAGWGEITHAKTGGNARLMARLPVGWLAEVWAPDFAVVGSHLVVAVLHADWPQASVLALRWPGDDPVELSIRQDQGHWNVTSR